MEALPFLPFVQIPPKLTETNVTPSLSGAIRVAIAQTGRNPDEHLGGLREFETLRNAMIVAIGDSAIHKSFLAGPSYYDVYGDALRQYAVQATSIFKRFNGIYIEGNSWQTANQKRNTVKSDTMAFEMASALWNHSHYLTIHALHELSLENDENIKQAATNFQQAAGCLTYILGKCHDLPGKDLSPANIKLVLLMLQQAHEVIVIKALRDSKLQKTAAKLAWTCADYCEQLEALLPEEAGYKSSEIKFLKTWIVFKMEFFQAITHFCQGMDAEERKEYGQAVTYFRQARQCLGNSQKQAAKLDSDNDLAAALGYADDVINGKCTSAENDNEFIYHMAVKESLPPPGTISKPIVNAVPWEPDDREYFGDVISEDIFISNSNYSDRLDQLWRDISKEIDDKNNELKSCKEALVIAGIDLESEKTDRSVLPESLIQAAAQAEKMRNNCSKLTTCLKSISKYESQVDEKINAAEKKFVADEEMLKNCPPGDSRAKFDKDPAWLALHARIMKIKKAADQSKGPTLTCKDAASLMAEKLEMLGKGLEAVREELPAVVISDDDAEAIGMVSMLLSKIREMENQREEQKKLLKDELDADNITGKLAGEPEHLHSKIFDTEIAKHDIRIGYLRQNLSAQGNILAVLDDARVNYAEIYRRKRDSTQLYDEKCSQLINAIINYDKIYDKLIGGQKLLEKILGELAKLDSPLESAATQRSQALQKLTAPKRPEKPKPVGNATANLPKEMLEELKALGLEDDQEFIEFLKSSGEMKNAASPSQPPANIPKLPGISPKKVANAMRGGAPSARNYEPPNYQSPIRPVKAAPPATQFNRPLPADTRNVQSYNGGPSVSATSDLPPKMNFDSTVRPTKTNETYNFPASTQQAPTMNSPKASSEAATEQFKNGKTEIIPDQGTNINEVGPSNTDQVQSQVDISKFNQQQHLQQQRMFNFQQQELQKQQWMMQQQFQAQMQQQQQQIEMKRREDEAKLAHERRTMMEQMKQMEQERSKLEDERLKFEKERKNHQDHEKPRVQYVAPMPQMPPSSSFQSQPTGEQWLLQYRSQHQQQSTGAPGRNPTQNFAQANVQGPMHYPVAPAGPKFVPVSRPSLTSSPASTPAPATNIKQPYRMPIMANLPHPMMPQMSQQPVPRPTNPVQSSQSNHSVIRQPNQPPLLRPTITSKPINSIVPVPQTNSIATSEMKSTQANRTESNFDLLSNLSEFTPSPTEKPTKIQNAQTVPVSTSFETTNLLNKISTLSASRITPRLAKVPDHAIHLITNTTYPPDQFRIMNKTIAAARCSTQHNRQQQLVPYDENRVILRGPGNDYINASRVSTMCTSIPFAIVSETPLPLSQDDLWRMAWQENIEILVMIASPEEATDDSIMSWHPRGSNRQFPRAGIIVESRVTEKSDFVSVYNVTLSKQNIKRTISVYEITQWAAQLTPNIEALGAVTAKIATRFINQRSKDIPITFMSSNGDARCGTLLFIIVLLIAPDFHPLSLYKTLQESRSSLLMSRISKPALDIFKSINSHIS